MGKVWSLYRTPGPDPIEINDAFFLVEICDFVIQSGMNVHYECVFAPVLKVTTRSPKHFFLWFETSRTHYRIAARFETTI
jgi:hypothetical protein